MRQQRGDARRTSASILRRVAASRPLTIMILDTFIFASEISTVQDWSSRCPAIVSSGRR